MMHAASSLFFCAKSDIGFVREKNEDAWNALFPERFFVLADGMGGLASGEIASQTCIDLLSNLIQEINQIQKGRSYSLREMIELFGAALSHVNTAIYEKGKHTAPAQGMGTTICALYFLEDAVIYANVGDSRIYHFKRDEEGHSLFTQLSEDHSLCVELINRGELSAEDAKFSPYKNILTRAIGIQPTVEPSLSWMSVESKELFLLCSDGLTNYGSDQEIQEILTTAIFNSKKSFQERLEDGVSRLISLAKSHGGGDNITVILVYIP
ncbi:MAG: serine/threonine-protein phosphatase [Chlamydiia bacterium]|nr:serine/threonine-protein phosphatase [Chlamydiia bacterium]